MSEIITPKDAALWLADGQAILIDVREADEFRDEHIAYANSLPLSNLKVLFEQLHIPTDRKVIFHCLKGKRGEEACVNAKAYNICDNEIYNLEGGITAWKDAGLPIVQQGTGVSVFRQVQMVVGSLIALLVVLGFMGVAFGFILAGFFGAALFISGITGWCGLALILKKMPWNK